MVSKADIIESLLFASEKPLPVEKLAQITELKPEEVLEEINILREEKSRIGALQLVEVAGGWQVVTKPAFASYVRQLRDVPRQKLSRAAFEVLAVVAYRQPVTRADIEGLRGVDCAGPLGFLLEKKLVNFAGRRETPGRPWLYATTPQFLDNFGLRSMDDLPSLSELAELSDTGPRELFTRGPMKVEEAHAEADERGENVPGDEALEAAEAVATGDAELPAEAEAVAQNSEITDTEPVAEAESSDTAPEGEADPVETQGAEVADEAQAEEPANNSFVAAGADTLEAVAKAAERMQAESAGDEAEAGEQE